MKIIVAVVFVLFAVLCGLINLSIKQLICRNEYEYMQVTALRLIWGCVLQAAPHSLTVFSFEAADPGREEIFPLKDSYA